MTMENVTTTQETSSLGQQQEIPKDVLITESPGSGDYDEFRFSGCLHDQRIGAVDSGNETLEYRIDFDTKNSLCIGGRSSDNFIEIKHSRDAADAGETIPVPALGIKLESLFVMWLLTPGVMETLYNDLTQIQQGHGVELLKRVIRERRKNRRYRRSGKAPSHHRPPLSPDALANLKSLQRSSTRTPSLELAKEPVVPRFHWPEGKPPPTSNLLELISKAEDEFSKLPVPLLYAEFGKFLVSIEIPLYWKKPFWDALGLEPDSCLEKERFIGFYRRLISECRDDASRFMRLLTTATRRTTMDNINNNNSKSRLDKMPTEITMNAFVPMIQDIIDTHPGLGFLRDAPEFHSRYVTTVISRIFYKVNRSWSGRITLSELRRSNVLSVIKRLEEETDVNAITEYFSYEHFYVIYCKFWELDKDHDLLIDKNDLTDHSQQALSHRIIERIFSGTVIRGWDMNSPVRCPPGKMTYSDFVWFLISEEDKKTPTAIEYWFRCLDIDGDGILAPYELQYFYSEQEKRIESLSIEPLDFSNVYCQIVDMLRCSPNGIRLQDLKRNPHLASNVINTLINLDKYLDHEQRDPFATAGLSQTLGQDTTEGESDWDKYAAAEYDILIAEESPGDHLHESSDFEDGMSGFS